MMQEERQLIEEINDFNQQIFEFEDERVKDMRDSINLLASLQKELQLIDTSKILNQSLDAMMTAETQEEMEVFLNSYLAALNAVKVPNAVNLQGCIIKLHDAANDLFSFMNSYEEYAQLNPNFFQGTIEEAQDAFNEFNDEVEHVIKEFKAEIQHNIYLMSQLKNANNISDASAQNDLKHLEDLNLQYEAGIYRLESQANLIKNTLELIQQIPHTLTVSGRQELRANYANALYQAQLVDRLTGYNYFLKKNETDAYALFTARCAYLPKTISGVIEPVINVVQFAVNPFVPLIERRLPTVPDDFLKFSVQAESLHTLISNRSDPDKRLAILGKRSDKIKKPADENQGYTLFKKIASFILGVSGIFLSAFMCATGVLAVKGILIAAKSVSILKTVLQGGDFFTEHRETIKHNNKVMSTLKLLEQQHDQLEHEIHARNKKSYSPTAALTTVQPSAKSSQSAALLRRLLMGVSATEILSKERIDELKQSYTHAAPLKQVLPTSPSHEEEQESEGESPSGLKLRGPH